MKILQLNCEPIDTLLNGGIQSGTITMIYGEAGSGKTNICLQATREYTILDKKVVYIDTEGVIGERLRQISQGYENKKILENINYYKPKSIDEQEKIINKSLKLEDTGMIIIDSFNLHYCNLLEKEEDRSCRSLNRQLTNLQIDAQKKDIYIILTGRVYSTDKNDVKPYGGKIIEKYANTIIKLEKNEDGNRKATIMKNKETKKVKSVFFKISKNGLI